MFEPKIRKNISFKCRRCDRTPQVIEINGSTHKIECISCGIHLVGEDFDRMRRELLIEYRDQVGRNFNRRLINERRMGRVPLTKVDNEFSDPHWPFILVIEGDA